MPIPAELDPVFDTAGERYNIDPNLLRAVALQESGANPQSPRGAAGEIGMMQFMPATAAEVAPGMNPADPVQAIDMAAKYLRQNLDHGLALKAGGTDIGDPVVYAVRAYNGGPGGATNNPATAVYAGKVAGHYNRLGQAEAPPAGEGGLPPDLMMLAGGSGNAPPIARTGGAAPAQAAGADDTLLQDYFSGKILPYQAPAAPPSAAAGPPASGSAAGSSAAPAIDVHGLLDTYNRYRAFPQGAAIAGQALSMLQRFAPEGYEVMTDGNLRLRAGYAAGAAQLEAAKANAQQQAELAAAGPKAQATAAGTGAGAAATELVPVVRRLPDGTQIEGHMTKAEWLAMQHGPGAAPGAPPGPSGAADGGATGIAPPSGGPASAGGGAGSSGITLGGKPVEPLGYGEASKKLGEYSTAAANAQDELATIQSMRDLMSRGMATGLGTDTRVQIGRYLAALSVDPKSIEGLLGINPADADAFQKQALRLSSEAVRSMGAREPGSVISMFTRAYPSLETQPQALDLMTNMLGLQAQRVQDRRDFILDRSQGGVAGLPAVHKAEAQFDRASPTVAYLHAAEAMTKGYHPQAWGGAETDLQKQAILDQIPPGRSYYDPGGTLRRRVDTLTMTPPPGP